MRKLAENNHIAADIAALDDELKALEAELSL